MSKDGKDTEDEAKEWLNSFLNDPLERLTLLLCTKLILDGVDQAEKEFGLRLTLHCQTSIWVGTMCAAILGGQVQADVARRIHNHIGEILEANIAQAETKKAGKTPPEP